MRFAGENNLDRVQRIREQALEPIEIREYEIGPLVTCKTPRKTDGEHFRFKKGSKGNYAFRSHALVFPALAGALVDFIDQQPLQAPAQPPQIDVRYFPHQFPNARPVLITRPI